MLEKSAKVVMTSYDFDQYKKGEVSERLQELWGLTLDELKRIVENHDFVKIDE